MITFAQLIAEIGKDLRNDYVEAWLKCKVKDFDMDMALIEEKKHRKSTYKKLYEEE